MIDLIIKALYFFLPAYFANMSPPIITNIKFIKKINKPIDFKRTINNKRIFGDNKTIIGFLSGIIFALIIFSIQQYLFNFDFFHRISIIDYNKFNPLFPLLLGFGAMFGDLIKSFVKRRLNISSGSSFPIADQLDFVVFALIFSSFIYLPDFKIILILLILTPFLCILINLIAFKLKLKKVWY
ncbi:MAG TPA: CDP-2,3-bis-(O-geranylgeranyl)-sn-glycerol synthase [Candidatus Nanoarchaeia archaeon]|nr:CDP-2,3-bis-(O-geranylgeranyl)-sn-glycerol synthase [Candidatus Nanoarchaeia archaeon]